MANPQRENGHLDIANELIDVLATLRIKGTAWQIIWAIWRKTWCWHKKEDWISLTQLEKLTNLNRVAVCRAKKLLVSKMILVENGHKIAFNKNYEQWVVSKLIQGSVKTVLGGSVKNDTYKRNYTKETNTKEMKNKKYFVNQYRERLGKPPITGNFTETQLDFFKRSELIPIFQEAVNHAHTKSYFTNPHDIEDIKKENSKVNGAIKLFWIRCDKDKKKATEIILWYAGKYGEWKDWSPMFCFRKQTVIDFENRKIVDQSKWNK